MSRNFYHDRDKYGKAGEAFFANYAGYILDLDAVQLEELPQRPRNEGDYICRVTDPASRQWCVEVKADIDGGYLKHGNVLVQIANDACKQLGWIRDIQQSDPAVDVLTWVLFADEACKRPYATISVGVRDFTRMMGCTGSGCSGCQKQCDPRSPDWNRSFPGFWKLPKQRPTFILVNVFQSILPYMPVRIVIFDKLEDMDLDRDQRQNLKALITFSDAVNQVTTFINPLHEGVTE